MLVFVMYYIYVTSGSSLLIESTDSMIIAQKHRDLDRQYCEAEHFSHTTLFANCHCGYNSSSYTSDEDIKQLGKNITLMTNYSESITFIISQNNTSTNS